MKPWVFVETRGQLGLHVPKKSGGPSNTSSVFSDISVDYLGYEIVDKKQVPRDHPACSHQNMANHTTHWSFACWEDQEDFE